MGILEDVNSRYETLSPVQKRIADFIFKYPDQVCFYSLKDLSETLGVTEVTILRFTKKIGVASYVEMKRLLREHMQNRLAYGDPLYRVSDYVGKQVGIETDKAQLYREFAENEQKVIHDTYERIQLERVLEAVAIIRQAGTVYVVGSELVTGICSYLTRRLLTIGVMAIDLSSETRAIFNNYMSHIGPEDAVILFSAPGYAKHIVNTARYLEKNRVPQIMITDQPTAPAAAYVTTMLLCDNHDLFFFNSVMGYLSAANLLVYFTAVDDPEETNRLRGRLSEAREAIGSVALVADGKG